MGRIVDQQYCVNDIIGSENSEQTGGRQAINASEFVFGLNDETRWRLTALFVVIDVFL
jgi:hypothetical protein